ncbi:MAG: hypothetical protein ACR2QW_20420 [bacterium]
MSYLFDRVNSELMGRIAIHELQSGHWLQIDFRDSTLKLPTKHIHQCFPLDGDSIIETLSGCNEEFDVVIINLPLAWLEFDSLLPMIKPYLGPGCRLFFVTLGPDTLVELRDAWAGADTCEHVHSFVDLHHIGDLLVKAGFSKPIVDADWLGVEYQDLDLLLQDLRMEGFHNVLASRRKTLTGKSRGSKFREIIRSAGDPVQMTFELIYGYAEVSANQEGKIRVNIPTMD